MAESGTPGLGIYSRTFERPTLGAVLDSVAEHGFALVHLSLRSAGMASLPAELSRGACDGIRREVEGRGLRLAGVSGTFNAIHPDRARRERETDLACRLVTLAGSLGTSLVTLSTGTRDPDDMWRHHPANDEPSAWHDLRSTLARLLEVASDAGVTLGIEPERNNVVSSARSARRILDETRDEHLRIVLDPANLLTPETAGRQRSILVEAFDLLASDIVVVHAKDFGRSGDTAAGRGLLDYDAYFELLARHRVAAPVVIHEVEEEDVDRARDFVLDRAAHAGLTPLTAR